MALTNTEKSLILTELTTDPLAIGYAADITAGNYVVLSNTLNAVDPGAATIQRDSVPIEEVHNAVDADELVSMIGDTTNTHRLDNWKMFLSANKDNVKKNGSNIANILKKTWSNALSPVSFANIVALQTKDASRVEAVIDREYVINYKEVQEILS